MIEVKQAVQIAKKDAIEMLNSTPVGVEEVERDSYKERDVWSITLSFLPNKVSAPFAALMPKPDDLQYKRFFIDLESGQTLAIKMR